MQANAVDIIIINWNTKDLLERLLNSIRQSTGFDDIHCVVADNGSVDGSAEMVRMRFPEVEVLDNNVNLGYGVAANAAIENTQGEFIFLLNSDTEVYEDTIDKLVSFMNQHIKAGAAGPKLLNTDGSLQYSCRRFPNLWMGTFHALLGLVWKSNPYTRAYKMEDWDHMTLNIVDWISGAAMFLRRQAIEEIGLFDERYFMYVEDVDLCWRLKKAGWQVFYYPSAQVLHHIAKSSEKRTARMIAEHHRSVYKFYRSQSRTKWSLLYAPFVIVGLMVRALVVIIGNRMKK